jgi:hypothetical protein
MSGAFCKGAGLHEEVVEAHETRCWSQYLQVADTLVTYGLSFVLC